MAKKKKKNPETDLSAEDMAEIEELTGSLGPEVEIPAELQEELDEAVSEAPEPAADAEAEPGTDAGLEEELESAREEARSNHELYVRALAEMDNLRKRGQREKEDIAKFGNENILREILPVIDNLERAVEHAAEQEGGEGLLEGVQMTLDQFSGVLQKFGVESLESLGEVFDPAHHQAMGQMETDEVPVNHVAQELQKGYLLNSRLLRPSLVMVATAPKPQTEETPEVAEDGDEAQG